MKLPWSTLFLLAFLFTACSTPENESAPPDSLASLEGGKVFAVPTGTVADQFVLQRFPDAKFAWYNTVYDCALAVSHGKADAAVYDLPVLKNIAGKTPGLTVLKDVLVPDSYGFAVAMNDTALKRAIDRTLVEIRRNGTYDDMLRRWMPEHGAPEPMPDIPLMGGNGVLVFGTAAVTEPMSFVDADHHIVGFDVEFATRVAKDLNKHLEIVNMDFGAMLPALIAGKVDMIGAGLSITEERAKSVLFSECYYNNGLAALVRVGQAASVGDEQSKWAHIGVLMGSIHEGYANKNYPDAEIFSYNTVPDMLTALGTGKVDIAFVDQTALKEIFKANPELRLVRDNLFTVDIAAGFHQSSDELRESFNTFLREIRADGTYDDMVNRWMEEGSPDYPEIAESEGNGILRAGVVSDIGLPVAARVDGQFQGFDIELVCRFAAWSGRRLELVDMPFGSLLPSLISGKVDMITASIMITEERARAIDFSDPYYASGASIIGRKTAGTMDEAGRQGFWSSMSEGFRNNIIQEKRYLMIIRGLWVTIVISVLAALLGTVLGGLICAMRMARRPLMKRIARGLIGLIRGTPVLVLLMIIYYVIFASVNINPVMVAVIAFGINFGAYVSEMFRTGVEGVDKGQLEAGIATGFTKYQAFRFIVLPQAIRRILPVYKGEFISLVKMTSIVGYIAVEDLTKVSDIIRSRTFDAFFPLLMAAVIYLILAWLLTLALDRLELSTDPMWRVKKGKEVRS